MHQIHQMMLHLMSRMPYYRPMMHQSALLRLRLVMQQKLILHLLVEMPCQRPPVNARLQLQKKQYVIQLHSRQSNFKRLIPIIGDNCKIHQCYDSRKSRRDQNPQQREEQMKRMQ